MSGHVAHATHGGNPEKFEPCRRFKVGFHTILSLFIPGRKYLRVYMKNRTPKYAFSSRDNLLGLQDRVESCPGMSFNPGSSCKRMYVYGYGLS